MEEPLLDEREPVNIRLSPVRVESKDSIAAWEARPSRNVWLSLAFTFAAGTGRGVWSYTVLSGYLYELTGSNSDVGVAEGVQGIVQLVMALVAGVLIDKWRRSDVVLQLSAVIGVGSATALIVALASQQHSFVGQHRFGLITLGLGLFGAYQGFWNTALETIFADSVPTGRWRDKLNTRKFIYTLVSTCSGPLLANAYFYSFGQDKWSVEALRDVFVGGVCLCVPPMLMLFWFDDAECLGDAADAADVVGVGVKKVKGSGTKGLGATTATSSSDSSVSGSSPRSQQQQQRPQQQQVPQVERLVGASSADGLLVSQDGINVKDGVCSNIDNDGYDDSYGEGNNSDGHDDYDDDDDDDDDDDGNSASSQRRAYVLRVIAFNDLVSGLGSGMSIKYFPLYFRTRGLSPSEVNWLYIAAPLWMAAGSQLATKLSKTHGRPKVTMLFGGLGSVSMFGLGLLGQSNDHKRDHNVLVCVAWYFLSCAQHCCRPLKKSMLMDFCERKHRGRWNAIDSITRFGWSGSAVLGGFLVDRYSYGANFLVTGAFLAAAACMWPLLFFTVDNTSKSSSNSSRSRKNKRSTGTATYRHPSPHATWEKNELGDGGGLYFSDGSETGASLKGPAAVVIPVVEEE